MNVLTQADCLALWETGRSLHPLDKGLMAVQAAFSTSQESVADWPLGRRNRALAELRCASFGSRLRGWTKCQGCGEQLEFDLDGRTLAESAVPECDAQVVVDGQRYRLPTSRDIAELVHEHDASAAAEQLLRQCFVGGDAVEREWNEEQIAAIGESMAAADPLAEIQLSFDCPGCGVQFEDGFDLASFLWAELEARAKRTLMDVHLLASAYGWSETEILSLTPARREFYLEMVHA